MRWVARALVVLALAAAVVTLGLRYLGRRALPQIDGTIAAAGTLDRTEIVRDRWGVPHIFAASDEDAYVALGWVTAQDRLFQLELLRHLGQGRLSELFGPTMLKTDRLFRTMQLHRVGVAMLARARPEARQGVEAFARGVNASVAALHGRLPPEFAILGRDFEPARPDDFLGILGYMSWGLNMSWHFDPLYTKLAAHLPLEQMAEIFPFNFGGSPSAHPRSMPTLLAANLPLFDLSAPERAFLESLPTLRASNNWVLGPSKTTTGAPILANDPHLGHGAPGIWYEVHLKTPTQDVTGVTIPGLPFVVLGHNRDIAWGFTNVMLDGADFFAEKLRPGSPREVMSHGEWVELEERHEQIQVKGAAPVPLTIRSTPHGPLVSDLMTGQSEALSYQWNYFAPEGNEVEAIYALDRARNWDEFRAAVRHFGAVAQNVAFADRSGHIGLQTTGLIPRLRGNPDGSAIRAGWDGSEDWDGFIPFEENPASLDPPEGWLASANNPTVPSAPYYISSQWEPVDRYLRIREMIEEHPRLSLDDVKKMQMDTVLVSAREIAPMIDAAFRGQAKGGAVAAALAELQAWDGDMRADRAAPTLFSAFYRRLFYAIFEDEFGPELARAYRSHANVSAIMIGQVMRQGPEHWFDRVDTSAREDRSEILRTTFVDTVRELIQALGDDPTSWRWGRLHTITFRHALGRGSRLLAPYFDRGPFAVPGHTSTVNKMEFDEADFEVRDGPSMRQITDLGDLERSLAVLPMGQSGIPASPHYDDMLPLWLSGGYHPFAMDRANIEKNAEGRLVLEP